MKIYLKILFILSLSGISWANIASDSLFQLTSQWKNEKNESKTLKDFQGQPHVLALIFTTCKGVCPLIVNDIKLLQSKLPEESQKKARVIMVTMDPETDTPQVLSAFKDKMKLDDRWTLLNGSNDSVKELSAALEFHFKKSPTEKYTHSTEFYLVNAQGQVVFKQGQRFKGEGELLVKSQELFR